MTEEVAEDEVEGTVAILGFVPSISSNLKTLLSPIDAFWYFLDPCLCEENKQKAKTPQDAQE